MIDKLIELLKEQDKEIVLYIILELMRCGKIDFVDIANTHVEHLEEMRKRQSKELTNLHSKLVNMWCDNKKNVGSHIINLMQEAHDEGWANINQEQIDNSKWNK